MSDTAASRIDAFLSVQAICADGSHDPSPTLLRDSYALNVQLCSGFRHLEATPAPVPDETTVYMPFYLQVSEACTLAALAEGYRAILRGAAAAESEELLIAEVRRLTELVAADRRIALQEYAGHIAEELDWWLARLSWLVDHAAVHVQ